MLCHNLYNFNILAFLFFQSPKQKLIGQGSKDLSNARPGFKSVPLKIYFEIARLASAENWREIPTIVGKLRF